MDISLIEFNYWWATINYCMIYIAPPVDVFNQMEEYYHAKFFS